MTWPISWGEINDHLKTPTSWNDLSDKPFGVSVDSEVMLAETTAEFLLANNDGEWTTGKYTAKINVPDDFITFDWENEDFNPAVVTVCYDGQTYDCPVWFDRNADSHIMAFFGNISLCDSGSVDTTPESVDAPFVGFVNTTYAGRLFIASATTEETHTISMSKNVEVVETLDSAFLPKADAVANVTAAPTAQQFNSLLASLREAGYLAE